MPTPLSRKIQAFGAEARAHGVVGTVHARKSQHQKAESSFTQRALIGLAIIGAAYGAMVNFDTTKINTLSPSHIELTHSEWIQPAHPFAKPLTASEAEFKDKMARQKVDLQNFANEIKNARPPIGEVRNMPAFEGSQVYQQSLKSFLVSQKKAESERNALSKLNAFRDHFPHIKDLQRALSNPCEIKTGKNVKAKEIGVLCKYGTKSHVADEQTVNSTSGQLNIMEVGMSEGLAVYVAEKEGFGASTVLLQDGSPALVMDFSFLDQLAFEYPEVNDRTNVLKFIVTQQHARLRLELSLNPGEVTHRTHDQIADAAAMRSLVRQGASSDEARLIGLSALQSVQNFMQNMSRDMPIAIRRSFILSMTERIEHYESLNAPARETTTPHLKPMI